MSTVQTQVLPGHRIVVTSPELPEGAMADVVVVIGATAAGLTARHMMQLPIEERRRLMAENAARLAHEYAGDKDREQGGDIVEY